MKIKQENFWLEKKVFEKKGFFLNFDRKMETKILRICVSVFNTLQGKDGQVVK